MHHFSAWKNENHGPHNSSSSESKGSCKGVVELTFSPLNFSISSMKRGSNKQRHLRYLSKINALFTKLGIHRWEIKKDSTAVRILNYMKQKTKPSKAKGKLKISLRKTNFTTGFGVTAPKPNGQPLLIQRFEPTETGIRNS